jgi:hypothetical protein
MAYGVKSLAELRHDLHFRQQRDAAEKRDAHQEVSPTIKMVIGAWYLDQFGNQTREITARDQRPTFPRKR